MRTSHKLTRLILALMTLAVLSAVSLAQAANAPQNIQVSDQKAGSILVFPYYTSSTGNIRTNTRIQISNVSNLAPNGNLTRVHVFLMSGTTCTQADLFICLTPNASVAFTASDYDPDNMGYIIAVSVDAAGNPIINNVLIGNAFVNDNDGRGNIYEDNYGAEAFWAGGPTNIAVGPNNPFQNNGDGTATILWGNGIDAVPDQFAVEIQSPDDSVGQLIVTAGLNGDLSRGTLSGNTQVGTGQAYNQDERFASFQNFIGTRCLSKNTIDARNPRVPNQLNNLIRRGSTGTLKFNVTAAVGLIMTPKNNTNTWSGIRTLHKTRGAAPANVTALGAGSNGAPRLTIPIFVPVC